MKRSTKTQILKIYTVEVFKLKKVIINQTQYTNAFGKPAWREVSKVNASCYEKVYTKKFKKYHNLIVFLKFWYPRYTVINFYNNINSVIRKKETIEDTIIIVKNDEVDENQNYILKQQTKYKSKNKKRYYCECYRCTGMTKENFLKQCNKDEKILIENNF